MRTLEAQDSDTVGGVAVSSEPVFTASHSDLYAIHMKQVSGGQVHLQLNSTSTNYGAGGVVVYLTSGDVLSVYSDDNPGVADVAIVRIGDEFFEE